MQELFKPIMDLLRDGRYDASLRMAERALIGSPLTPEDLGRLQAIICRCRVQKGDHLGALSAANIAERLTRTVRELAEVRSQVLLDLMEVLLYLGRYEEALKHGIALVEDETLEQDSASQSVCWRNLGVCYKHLGRFMEAVEAFQQAKSLLDPSDGYGHACIRSYLVKAYTAAGDLSAVSPLLHEGEAYVRRRPGDLQAKVAHLWDSAEYQFAQGHLVAAAELTELALSLADRYSWHRYQCRMMLGRIAIASGRYEEALRHIMTARAIAVQGQHYDLEAAAADMMYTLLRKHPEAVTGEASDNRSARQEDNLAPLYRIN